MKKRHNRRRGLLVLIAVAALSVSLAGVVAPVQADETEVFTGCVHQNSGRLSKVAVGFEPAKPCNKKELLITWDRAGPAFEDRLVQLEQRVAGLEQASQTLEVFIDCDAGDTVGDALADAQAHPGPVNITISGVCEESIFVDRDDVSFSGTQRSDGIRGPMNNLSVVHLYGAQRVRFSNMTISAGREGISADSGSTFEASHITVRDASATGLDIFGGSSARVSVCALIDNADNGVYVTAQGGISLSDCEITGSEWGAFAGGFGTAAISVGDSLIAGNGNGVVALTGGTVLLSNTVVRNSASHGLFAIGGAFVFDGGTRVSDNGGTGVSLSLGSSAEFQQAGQVVEGNQGDGIGVGSGSSLWLGDTIVRNNHGHGISAVDLSTANVFAPTEIRDNDGWGIHCGGPPAVAVLGGQGNFNPSEIVLSGNGLGPTSCQ